MKGETAGQWRSGCKSFLKFMGCPQKVLSKDRM